MCNKAHALLYSKSLFIFWYLREKSVSECHQETNNHYDRCNSLFLASNDASTHALCFDRHKSCLSSSPYSLLFYPYKLIAALLQDMAAVFIAIARLLAMACVIIPCLACTFVLLGISFHTPKILATYTCRTLINICWWHLGSSSSMPGGQHDEQASLLPKLRHSIAFKHHEAYAALQQLCTGKCCSICRLSAYMSCGMLLGCSALACCKCGERMHENSTTDKYHF